MKSFIFIFFSIFLSNILYAQTSGTLAVSVMTSEVGGNYKPKNIVAIWVEDASGNFVKTLLAYAEERKKHLTGWKSSTTLAGSPYNTVDAITGATRTKHEPRTCTWNGKNHMNILVADGVYRLKMEITDKNGTGRSAVFNFTKGQASQTLTPADVPSFSNISIMWQPATSYMEGVGGNDPISVYPNPVTSKTNIYGTDIKSFEVYDVKGNRIISSFGSVIDMSSTKPGLYFVKVLTAEGVYVKKVIRI